MPIAGVALLLLVAAAAVFWFLRGQREEPTLAAPPTPASATSSQPSSAAPAAPAAPASPTSSGSTPAPSASLGDTAAARGEPRELDAGLSAATTVDVASLADLVTAEQRASETGRALDAALATFLATDDATARRQAAQQLVAAGRAAVPFVVDAWKRLDLADAAGRERAARIERELATPLADGRGFGWSAGTDAESELANRRVIAQWHALATRLASDEAWRAFVTAR